jgi:hypothetical protein
MPGFFVGWKPLDWRCAGLAQIQSLAMPDEG